MKKRITPHCIYKILPKTNCTRCLLPTCFAFSVAVLSGNKKITDCPYLDKKDVLDISIEKQNKEIIQPEFIEKLQQKIKELNLSSIAKELGANYKKDKLVINSLGKDFAVDQYGHVYSDCHVISWVIAPLLSYITNKSHQGISGEWILFREFKGGIEWQQLFKSRCEDALRDLVDEKPDLFLDVMDMFECERINIFDSDIATVLLPLPHFPILICYQAPDSDLPSELTIFFDKCCGVNLHIKSIFTLCSGLVQMFDKIVKLHG